MKLIHSFSWSIAAEMLSKISQPIAFVVLAAIISPSEFGIVTSAMIIISFCEIFWQAGMNKAIVQTNMEINKAASAAFFINIILSTLVIVILFTASSAVASFVFSDNRVSAVIKVLCIYVLCGSLSSVPIAILQRKMDFKKLFFLRLFVSTAPLLLSIPLALLGFSYWSLVWGTILGQLIQLLVLFRWSVFVPSISALDCRTVREMLNFGQWVFLAGLLAWFFGWADALLVGIYFDSTQLGLYRTGTVLVGYLFGIILSAILPVIYSHMSRKVAGGGSITAFFTAVVSIIPCVSLPLAAALIALSPYVEEFLFGNDWAGISFVISYIGLMVGFSTIVSANGEAYRAVAKPYVETFVTAGMLGVYIVVYLVVVRYGLHEFIYARVLLAAVALVAHLYLARYYGIISLFKVIPAIAAASLSALTIFSIFRLLSSLDYFPPSFNFVLILPAMLGGVVIMLIFHGRRLAGDVRTVLQP